MAELKQNIMRRIYVIYAFRMVVPKVAILTIALFSLKYFVSFVDVFRNMPSLVDVSHSVVFFWSAFAHTDIIVQTSLVATLAVLVFMARDLVRSAQMLSFAR